MPFEKINSQRKTYRIIDQLMELIKEGEYSKGDKLPSERVVADRLGVSRPLVREAYSALQIIDVIETRVGDGTYVTGKPFENKDCISEAFDVLSSEEDPIAVWKARESIESGNMHLVVENAEPKDIEELEAELANMEQAVDDAAYEEYFESDRLFHIKLAEASHNPYIQETLESLLKTMKQDLWRELKETYYIKEPEKLQRAFEYHRSVFESVERRDKDAAHKGMRRHFDEFQDLFGNE